MIDQSEILSSSKVQFITLLFGGTHLCCAFYQLWLAAQMWCRKTNFLSLTGKFWLFALNFTFRSNILRNVGDAPTPTVNTPSSRLVLIMRSEPMANLEEILRRSCEFQRGVGNCFQPAIDASRFFLTNCIIDPSAKMKCPSFRWPIYSTIKPNSDKGYGRNQTTAETSPWSSLKFLACEHTRNSSVVGLAIAGVGLKLGLWRRLRKSAINFVIQQIFWSSLNSGFIWS